MSADERERERERKREAARQKEKSATGLMPPTSEKIPKK